MLFLVFLKMLQYSEQTQQEKTKAHGTRVAQIQHCALRQDEEPEIPDELRTQQIQPVHNWWPKSTPSVLLLLPSKSFQIYVR